MKKVAIIGTQGLPAKYGGFESLVENIVPLGKNNGIQYIVYCSKKDYSPSDRAHEHNGATLKWVPLFHANGSQSIPYDILSMCKAARHCDEMLVLGVSGTTFLPFLRTFFHKKIIVNIDGLEHRREKWSKTAKKFLLKSEAEAVKYADIIVSDNKGIQDYVTETYGKNSVMIAYGGDNTQRNVSLEDQKLTLDKVGVRANEYAITICRVEPENNSHIILEAFAKTGKNLVFVGNWERSEYGRSLKNKYGNLPNIHLLTSVYDLDVLYSLRANCSCYIHGHSAGGTNPSLVEAMFFGKPIIAYNVVYNRETTENQAWYFDSCEQLENLIKGELYDGSILREIAYKRYTWKHIAEQYMSLF